MGRFVDLTGKKFGKLTVLRKADNYKKDIKWVCRCDCGNEVTVIGSHLKDGHTTSCGCKTNFNDIAGQKFGKLTAIEVVGKTKNGAYKWLCRCDCGNETIVESKSLKNGHTKSCGCIVHKEGWKENIIGEKFGKLTVLRKIGRKNKRKSNYWLCRCDCGNEIEVREDSLRNGHTKSCGCYNKERILERVRTHCMSNTRIYSIWSCIIDRVENINATGYQYYGGRGISVCQEWRNDFMSFYNWAISNGYEEHLTIDRIDVNGNYEPSNCRWANWETQANNKRNNHYVFINGERFTVTQISKLYNINLRTLCHRLEKMDIISAINYKRGNKQ